MLVLNFLSTTRNPLAENWGKIKHSIDLAFNIVVFLTGDFNDDQLKRSNTKINDILTNFM